MERVTLVVIVKLRENEIKVVQESRISRTETRIATRKKRIQRKSIIKFRQFSYHFIFRCGEWLLSQKERKFEHEKQRTHPFWELCDMSFSLFLEEPVLFIHVPQENSFLFTHRRWTVQYWQIVKFIIVSFRICSGNKFAHLDKWWNVWIQMDHRNF